MVPDAGMCPAMFPDTFDALGALERWGEEGIAPDKIIASHRDGARVCKTRPVSPYPESAIYKRSGDVNDAASFRCGRPAW